MEGHHGTEANGALRLRMENLSGVWTFGFPAGSPSTPVPLKSARPAPSTDLCQGCHDASELSLGSSVELAVSTPSPQYFIFLRTRPLSDPSLLNRSGGRWVPSFLLNLNLNRTRVKKPPPARTPWPYAQFPRPTTSLWFGRVAIVFPSQSAILSERICSRPQHPARSHALNSAS